MSDKISVDVEVLGGIWWPYGAKCSMQKSFTIGKGAFQVDIDPTFDQVESWVYLNTGDFSSIIDWRAIKTTTHEEYTTSGRVITESYEVIKDWKDEESEIAYYDTLGEA